MKRFFNYIFLLILIGFYGCESYYIPDVEQFPDALVVEGMLTDQNDYAKIKLSRSVSFNDQSYYYGERKAKVSIIESESGISYPTSEIGVGLYQTNEKVPTQIGDGYYLKIVTLGGEEYHSEIEKMVSPTPIDSIYLTDSTYKDITYNYWNEPVVRDYTGITISVIPREPAESEVGFLYKWNAISNYYVASRVTLNPIDPPMTLTYNCWKQLSSNLIYVYEYVHDDFINELPMADLHSISFYALNPFPLDSARFEGAVQNVRVTSFYYHLRQYTISKEGSKFWRSVKNQSEVSGKLFDPVEEDIIGNIRCVSDSAKVAFGFFNVASFTDKVIGVELLFETHKEVKIFDVMPTPESGEDCYLNDKPDFWY